MNSNIKIEIKLEPEDNIHSIDENIETPHIDAIENALALNIKAEESLLELQRQLTNTLSKCRDKKKQVQSLLKSIENPTKKTENTQKFSYYNCGIPFFKDAEFNPSPPNTDVKKMEDLGLADILNSNMSFFNWSLPDKKTLELEINEQIKKCKGKVSMPSVAEVKREDSADNLQGHLIETGERSFTLDKLPVSTFVQSLDMDDNLDWESIAKKSGVKHSHSEVRSMWRLYLHPSINRKAWTTLEQHALNNIAVEHYHQDWDDIARQLGTGRSAYQCFIFYRTRLATRDVTPAWTDVEDHNIVALVEKNRIGSFIPWAKVSSYFPNHTKSQVYNRWTYTLSSDRRGRFSHAEDNVVLAAIREIGENFHAIAEFLPGRNSSQVRCRYRTLKCFNVVWTVKEEVLLLNLVKSNGPTNPINFQSLSKHFENKSTDSLKMRLKYLRNWLKFNPRMDLVKSPRKKRFPKTYIDYKLSLRDALQLLQNDQVRPDKPRAQSFRPKPLPVMLQKKENFQVHAKFLDYYKKKIQVQNISPANTASLNIQELRNVLLLLNVQFDKELLQSMSFQSKPELRQNIDALSSENVMADPSRVKVVKTYSRKRVNTCANVPNCSITKVASIWRTSPDLLPLEFPYALPPSFDIVKAFGFLMSNKFPITDSIDSLFFDESKNETPVMLWKLRFEKLFRWPANLSSFKPTFKVNIFEDCQNDSVCSKEQFEDSSNIFTGDFFTKNDNKPYLTASGKFFKNRQNQSQSNSKSIDNITMNHSENTFSRKKYFECSVTNQNSKANAHSSALHVGQSSDCLRRPNRRKLIPNTDLNVPKLESE